MRVHPVVEIEKHILNRHVVRNFVQYFNKTYYNASSDVANVVCHKLHHVHGDMVLFTVLCAIRTQLRSRWCFYCTLLFVQFFPSKASSCGKHHMGALSWLNAETHERVPITIFGILVRCSTHGCFFAILNY